MSRLTEEQLRLVRGNYSNFEDYLDRRIVKDSPFKSPNSFTLASPAQLKLLDAPTHLDAGVISKNAISNPTNPSNDGGLVTASLVGAVGTAANTSVSDSEGTILNIVEIQDGTTNNEVVITISGVERKVFALIQSSNTVTDGDAIGSSGSENVQLSFVYYDSAGALTLVSLPAGTYDFQIVRLYIARNIPNLTREGAARKQDVVDVKIFIDMYGAAYEVTTEFPANDVITLSTGAGATGVSTPSGDNANILLPTTSAEFDADPRVKIFRNGVKQRKGTGKDVVYNSTTTFHFTVAIRVGEVFEVEAPVQFL